jgi:hypothetical protein
MTTMMMTVESPAAIMTATTTNTTRNPMTTERRPSNRETRLRMSPLELRLYVAALLAVVYTISWRAIGGPATDPPIAIAPMTSQPQRFVWIDNLPQSSLAPTERIVRVPTRRVPRARTRSS